MWFRNREVRMKLKIQNNLINLAYLHDRSPGVVERERFTINMALLLVFYVPVVPYVREVRSVLVWSSCLPRACSGTRSGQLEKNGFEKQTENAGLRV